MVVAHFRFQEGYVWQNGFEIYRYDRLILNVHVNDDFRVLIDEFVR